MFNWRYLSINSALLAALSLLLLPKLFLIEYFSSAYIDTDIISLIKYFAQDILLILMLWIISKKIVDKQNTQHLIIVAFIFGSIFTLLITDLRVRELWLKPLDLLSIKYAITNFDEMLAGTSIFFNFKAGFNLTYRFVLFISAIYFLISWSLVWYTMTKFSSKTNQTKNSKTPITLFSMFLLTTLIVSIISSSTIYSLNKNIIVAPLITWGHSIFYSTKSKSTLGGFEQPLAPLTDIYNLPKLDINKEHQFKNLVIVILESVRWKSVFGQTAVKTPVFKKLAQEGLSFKSYITIPHSSKGYHAILTGTHPYPMIEIKEAMMLEQQSIFRELIDKNNMDTLAFSSLNLLFENLNGFLTSLGINAIYPLEEINPLSKSKNSFGSGDEYLYSSSLPYLKNVTSKGKGFAAIYFPFAAHFPYHCKDNVKKQSDFENYQQCINYQDGLIGSFIEELRAENLLEDTLMVFVGDHGESFGEHGLFIHNSSMYEEEVTVPLIFWASNKRLATGSPESLRLSQQIDIVPTIADLFNVKQTDLKTQGKSLLRENQHQALFMTSFFDHTVSSLVQYPYKYIYEHNSKLIQKFNLESDPLEQRGEKVEGEEALKIQERLDNYIYYQKNQFKEAN